MGRLLAVSELEFIAHLCQFINYERVDIAIKWGRKFTLQPPSGALNSLLPEPVSGC
jgi:hypothetical protein